MLSKLRSRLSYANVVSTICLFIVLGGSAYAAATVITGKNVKNGSLTGKDVKNSSLTGGDVKNKSLSASDFNGSVQGPKGDTGAQGPTGDPGKNGKDGLPGSDAPADGPAVVMGRIADPGGTTDCLFGAPSGVSASVPCNLDDAQKVAMPLPSDAVVLNFTARLTAPLAHDFFVELGSGGLGAESMVTGCKIPAGSTTCTGASSSVSAGAPAFTHMVETDTQGPVAITSGASFAYELWSPSAVPPAVVAKAKTNAMTDTRLLFARRR